ncbi:hypothetical protein H8R18_05240 [Nanchangia anserum]|uniref:Uncharacterized protein n=1 Tax=Nanchangia anserum TaxID=2692125 RepID=A0A8I0GDN1_9ACTO|nr:hypothetical protein [Nanchangia anserum]MBD3688947.1 hypothetical protein [Nanchangia anserum]QOX81208.1 hypothetical protein H8R18_05240 [Nanchangia anserum]
MTQEGAQNMSDDEQEQGPDTTPDDNLEAFLVDLSACDDEDPMTLRELQEALEDESHPRHVEAVQRNKELAERLRPAIDSLQQTMIEQTGIKELQKTMAASVPKVMPSIDLSKLTGPAVDKPEFDFMNSAIEQYQRQQRLIREAEEEFQRVTNAIADARAERQEMEDQRARQTLDVLISMDARLVQLNSRIEGVDARIEASNTSSSKGAGWTITVAVLTLLATISGIVVTVMLSR